MDVGYPEWFYHFDQVGIVKTSVGLDRSVASFKTYDEFHNYVVSRYFMPVLNKLEAVYGSSYIGYPYDLYIHPRVNRG